MIGDRSDRASEWDVTYSYDREKEAPSEVVARAVASTTDRSILSIDPLYTSIEPDALDVLISRGDEDTDVCASFSFENCHVYIDREAVAVSQTNDDAAE